MQIHQGCRRETSNKGSHKQTGNFTQREIFKTYFPLGLIHRQKLTFKMYVWLRDRGREKERKWEKGVKFTLGWTCRTSSTGQGMAYITVKSFCSDQKNTNSCWMLCLTNQDSIWIDKICIVSTKSDLHLIRLDCCVDHLFEIPHD